MNYSQQGQTHQLGQTWQAEDYARHSQQSAYVAKQYHKLMFEQASVYDARFTQLEQKVLFLEQDNRRLRGLVNGGQRNPAILWGVGSAIVAGLVVSLILAPSQSPRHVERNSGITFQFGGQ